MQHHYEKLKELTDKYLEDVNPLLNYLEEDNDTYNQLSEAISHLEDMRSDASAMIENCGINEDLASYYDTERKARLGG